MSNLVRNDMSHGRALGAGSTMAVAVGLFAYGGLWLDARFGTKPWLLLLCVGCGITGGILHLIRELAPASWPFGTAASPRGDAERNTPTNPTSSSQPAPSPPHDLRTRPPAP